MQPDIKWKPPKQSFLKLNVDASFTADKAGVGLVIRDHFGSLEAVMTESFPQCLDAFHAETLGFLKASEFARDFGITHLEVEGDAQAVIRRINSTEEDLSLTGHIIAGIRCLMSYFPDLSLVFVSRRLNLAAHEAAKLAIKSTGSFVWFTNFPKSVLTAVKDDLS